ncbi:hypothetical protein [Kocuria rosea]|nr:hypothetical protein [Kocuria rosea]
MHFQAVEAANLTSHPTPKNFLNIIGAIDPEITEGVSAVSKDYIDARET